MADFITTMGDMKGHQFRRHHHAGLVADGVALCDLCGLDGETFLAEGIPCPVGSVALQSQGLVHLIQNGAAVHATTNLLDFTGTENPDEVTCPTCLAIVGRTGEPAPSDDLESLSLAEHLGILVASHVTMLEQQRDQARMWATTLEQQLAEAVAAGAEVAEVLARVGTTFAADTGALERLNRFLEAVGSPDKPDHPEGTTT